MAVVAHTHWDREWYSPLEAYRTRLVPLIDGLLELLDEAPSFESFLLDGQMAMVDDYLAVRPERTRALARLMESGRLQAGPWYVLMDEFCVSGETIWRNLRLGLSKARSFGCTTFTGYLPDMFGHVAQMPQILAQAGLDRAVVWRGVPDVVNRTAFWWTAPDGSTVRAEYLPVGYANGAFLPRDAEELVRRIAAHEAEIGELLPDGSWPMLLMNGGDHLDPQSWMPDVLSAANAAQDRYRFEQSTLADYLSSAPVTDLPAVAGELRSGARANLLLGVASTRVDVKMAAAAVERRVEKLAEPLSALWLPPDRWPSDLLDDAWLAMILNSAHDSICACSADAVSRVVRARFDSASALADAAVDQALSIAEVATVSRGSVVLNPHPADRAGVVEIVVAGTEVPPGAQLLEAIPASQRSRAGTGIDLGRFLGELASEGVLGDRGLGTDAAVRSDDAGVTITLEQDDSAPARPEMAAVMAEAWAQAGAAKDKPLTVLVNRTAVLRVAVRTPSVAGFGWATWDPAPLAAAPVRAGDCWLDNGLVRVDVDPREGTFSLNGHTGLNGLNGLIDEGDDGDTYTFSPVEPAVSAPTAVQLQSLEAGPVRGSLRVRRRFEWPRQVDDGLRTGCEPVEVVSDIDVRAGEHLVRVTTSFDNRCRDHRVRALFPLSARAGSSLAETAFGTVRRPANGYGGGPHEVAVPMFPSRRFVQAGELTLVHDGLIEYELISGGSTLALTLLRAVGTLSKPAPRYRPNPAGPALPVPDAQMPGWHRFRYALALGSHDPWRLADEAWTPLMVVRSDGTGHLPAAGSRLRLEGGAQVSSLRRVDGRLELRVFNPSDQPVHVGIPGHTGALVDLAGGEVGRWDGGFELPPGRIATARLDAVSLD